jgi:hypothetical protein
MLVGLQGGATLCRGCTSMGSSVRSLTLSLPLATIVIGCGFSASLRAESSRYCAAYFGVGDPSHITLFPMTGPEVTVPLPPGLPATFQVVAFSPDGTAIYGQKSSPGPSDGLIKIEFRPARSTELRRSFELGRVWFVTPLQPAGKIFVCSGLRTPEHECGVYELDPESGTIQAVRVGMRPGCGGALGPISPDGKRVLSYGGERLSILDMKTGNVDQLGGGLTQGSWSPDGRWIAAWGNGKIVLIDAANTSARKKLGGSGFGGVFWSPDSKQLLIGKSQLSCAPTLFGESLEVVDVASGHRSLIKSSHCRIVATTVGWIDREAVQ